MLDSCAGRTPPLHQPEGQMFAILDQHCKVLLLLLHRLEGLHQLHLVLSPEGIALGDMRESRPGIRDHNGATFLREHSRDSKPTP